MKIRALPLIFLAAAAFAQTNDPETRQLNITFKEILEADFIASRAISLRSADGTLRIEAGAVVEAQDIRITLRQVHGEVTFRGSLDRLREVIDRFNSIRRSP